MTTVSPASVREEAETLFRDNWDPEIPLGHWWERLADSGWGFRPERLLNGTVLEIDPTRTAPPVVGMACTSSWL